MKPLEPPDSHYWNAAQGWLGLGDWRAAAHELAQLGADQQQHPEVLMVRWAIEAAAGQWEASLDTASALIQVAPEQVFGWLHRSYALHELQRTPEARDNLLPVLERFPDDATLRYNLACYECQLGRLDLARQWLDRAFALDGAGQFKRLALTDPDLTPLREVSGPG